MQFHTIGPELFARNDQGVLWSRIATIFPDDNVIVTWPTVHHFQQNAYLDELDQKRQADGLAPMTEEEREALRSRAVSLYLENDSILIRPYPENMALTFAADTALQELLPKSRIRFLNALNPQVRDAIKRCGECWRITPLPKCIEEMQEMIRDARTSIENENLYYYSRETGTRWVSLQSFIHLARLDEPRLRAQLLEIAKYYPSWNRLGSREVDFFLADRSFGEKWKDLNFTAMDEQTLRATHQALQNDFGHAVPFHLRRDDVDNAEWRRRLYAKLVPHGEDVISEEELLGLGSEFYMQVEWLPGGRIDRGELILDSTYNDICTITSETDSKTVERIRARSLLFNLVREYGDLEYVNIGCINTRIARRPFPGGTRSVYVVEMKRRGMDEEILKIIRMQRWGIREHLDRNRPLLEAVLNSEEYTEYILDRRLACRQLGMNLPVQVVTRKISECYFGEQKRYWTTCIWSPYFERDYVHGITTDIVPHAYFGDREFARKFAELLGKAAAPNIIVGRQSHDGIVIFDNGDEVLIRDEEGRPVDIMVSDHTGAFMAFESDIYEFARAYARPVTDRRYHLADAEEFTEVYIGSLIGRFKWIQDEYRKRRRVFDTLFADRPRREYGSLAYRWERVLKRLDETDPVRLEADIRKGL